MRGIKTKIGLNVLFLILLSAVLTDIILIVVVQRAMLQKEIAQSTQYLERMGNIFFSGKSLKTEDSTYHQDLATTLMLSQNHIQNIVVVDRDKKVLYRQSDQRFNISPIRKQVDEALSGGNPENLELGYTWSLNWWQPKAVSVARAIEKGGRIEGAVAAVIPLAHIYDTLGVYHKPIFIYIIINTCVLTLAGLYRIFRLYLGPIDRIIQQADEFQQADDIFFAFRQEDNELNRLSSALNRMLNRISSDKKTLQTTVLSLERANSELKNAQKEIIRAEKMASVGRLAAGIAHEIGNPIGIVLGYLDMLKRNGLPEADQIDFLQRTEDEVQRINAIIRQLLDLARPVDSRNKLVCVSDVIRDIVDVMQLQPVMSNTDIQLRLDAADDAVWGNDDQVRQVFLNLLLNAADAIKGGPFPQSGRIEVSTANLDGVDGVRQPMLQVSFNDNGDGIEQEKLQNIFDPFYTTKEPGKGTGLGLAVSYMIIQGMGGTIRAQSQAGGGATFRIEFPLSSERQTK